MDSEQYQIITRVKAALDVGATDKARMRPHLAWEAGEMVSRLNADDLTTLELTALIAVLHAAHARVLTGPTESRPVLTVVPSELRSPQCCQSTA